MSPPVVVHFIETHIPGGAESLLLDLASRQRATGLLPMIAHFDHPYFTQRCGELGLESFALPKRSHFKRVATLPLFAGELAARLRRCRVRLLHSHLFGPVVGGALAAALARIPHVGTLHDIHMVEEEPKRIRPLQGSLLLGTRLVTVSRQAEHFYRTRLRWRRHRVICIHNGIDPDPAARPLSRDTLGIPAGDRIVIAVGRLVALKRIQDAIHALATVVRECPTTLLIVGDGPELEPLRSLTRELELTRHVIFTGARRDVAALLRSADLFIQCSETEGLSMSIIEALHAGLPCVVTDVGGNPELIRQDENGARYAVGDRAALARWILDLLSNPERSRLMGQRSRDIAAREFSSRTCDEQYGRLYAELGVSGESRP